jgi:hypothetical protein
MNTSNPYRLVHIQEMLLKETKAFIKALERGASSIELGKIRDRMRKASTLLDSRIVQGISVKQ